MAAVHKRASGLATQQKMLRAAMSAFLEDGYAHTTTSEIARRAGYSPTSFFRAFPSKEAILLEFVKWIFEGLHDLAEKVSGSNEPRLVCAVEAALEIYTTELSEQLRELYVTAYTLPSTSRYIYRAMSERLSQAFRALQPESTPRDFYEMEIASASMIRGFMTVPCDVYFTTEAKITRFLDCALRLYCVNRTERDRIIATVLAMDLKKTAEEILSTTIKKVEEGLPITGHLIY